MIQVPELSDIETKISSILTIEEVVGIDGALSMGIPQEEPTRAEPDEIVDLDAAKELPSQPISDGTTTATTSNSIVTKKRCVVAKRNDNLYLQREVLLLQKEYYTLKLEKLHKT